MNTFGGPSVDRRTHCPRVGSMSTHGFKILIYKAHKAHKTHKTGQTVVSGEAYLIYLTEFNFMCLFNQQRIWVQKRRSFLVSFCMQLDEYILISWYTYLIDFFLIKVPYFARVLISLSFEHLRGFFNTHANRKCRRHKKANTMRSF